ncbi:MAG: thermonuclease family protein [Polymorphobacter sp.]|uniref:thermonuclease family protein n=1 Tax=Polymorphobacter sp. TaxID=1909290 RepID=UPI003A857FE4
MEKRKRGTKPWTAQGRVPTSQKPNTFRNDVIISVGAFIAVFAVGMFAFSGSPSIYDSGLGGSGAQTGAETLFQNASSSQFALCGAVRTTCVVDGDTFWMDGIEIRIADIDTPEIGDPKCDYEYELGMKATFRLMELLNMGPFEVSPIGNRDEDRYGRKLRVVTRRGQSLGDQFARGSIGS